MFKKKTFDRFDVAETSQRDARQARRDQEEEVELLLAEEADKPDLQACNKSSSR